MDKKINEATSWGDIAEYQDAWKKFKAEKGNEAADALEFIDAWCKKHPDMDNEDDRNGMFVDISAMEESLKEWKAGYGRTLSDAVLKQDLYYLATDDFLHSGPFKTKEKAQQFVEYNDERIVKVGVKESIAISKKTPKLEGKDNQEDKECLYEIVYMDADGEEKTERYNCNEYDDARADYVNMANGNHGSYEYVVLRKVETNFSDEEEITEIDRTDDIEGVEESLKEDLEFDAMEDLKSEVYNALSKIYAKYKLKGATLNEFDSAVEFVTIHMRDEFADSLKEDKEEETEVEAEVEKTKEEQVEEHPIETTVEEVKEVATEVAQALSTPVKDEEEAEEQQEEIEEVVDEVVDDKFSEDSDDEDEMIVRDNDEIIDVDDDFDDDFGFGEGLKEDTVKKGNKWVNKGKEGTHGEFKTKKEADAQRKAMFANGYREEVEEDFDDDFGGSSDKFVPGKAEEFGITVDWDDMDDDLDDEDAKTFKKVVKNTDDKILDKHFGKDTPERKLVGAIKDIDEEAHETGHIKAKKPIELRARR